MGKAILYAIAIVIGLSLLRNGSASATISACGSCAGSPGAPTESTQQRTIPNPTPGPYPRPIAVGPERAIPPITAYSPTAQLAIGPRIAVWGGVSN